MLHTRMPVSLEELAPPAHAASPTGRPAASRRWRLTHAAGWARRWTPMLLVVALLCWTWIMFFVFGARPTPPLRDTVEILNLVITVVVVAVGTAFVLSRRAPREAGPDQGDARHPSTTDELTGVLNRRAFMEAAKREFDRARRYARPAAVLTLDIDHFKLVNDDYGRACGDQVLRGCAARWQAVLRDQDVLGRIGGEEFCIVLPETNGINAALIAERLRALTGDSPMLDGRCLVTVSIGWTVVGAGDKTWAEALERAGRALYAAKAAGRNGVSPALEQRSGATTPASRPLLVKV
jgi:diguanylate cyclase (GGDEF)-like protein